LTVYGDRTSYTTELYSHTEWSKKVTHFNFAIDCVTFQIFKPDMWPPNNPDLNPVDYAVLVPFSNESITDENLTRWKN